MKRSVYSITMETSENIDQTMAPLMSHKTNDIDENNDKNWRSQDFQKRSEFASSESQAPANYLQEKEQQENDVTEDEFSVDGSPVTNPRTDEVDRPSPRARVTRFDIGCKRASIFLQLFDVASDSLLIVQYLVDHEWSHFAWTSAFVLISSFVNIFISMTMYNQNFESNPRRPRGPQNKMANKLLWTKYYLPIVLVFQLAPLFRSWETLEYARESDRCRRKGDWNNQKKYYEKMLKEDREIGLLRIIECFLETAPQLILLVSIMDDEFTFNFKPVLQLLKVVFAIVSLALAVTTYHRDVRVAQPEKTVITKLGLIYHFEWHVIIIASRILSVSLVVEAWTVSICYNFLLCCFIIHTLVMTVWIAAASKAPAEFARSGKRDTNISPTLSERIKAAIFASILGVVFFFAYVDVIDSPTIVKRTIFYALCFVENILACYFWSYLPANDVDYRPSCFEQIAFVCILPYTIGITFMFLYDRLIRIQKKQNLDISSNRLIAILTENPART